jgi:hypothetical protein
MSSSVFGTPDIAVVLVDGRDVWSTAFGASDEGFGSFAVGDEVTEAETAATLE